MSNSPTDAVPDIARIDTRVPAGIANGIPDVTPPGGMMNFLVSDAAAPVPSSIVWPLESNILMKLIAAAVLAMTCTQAPVVTLVEL